MIEKDSIIWYNKDSKNMEGKRMSKNRIEEEKKIIARYITKIYDDGSMEVERLPIEIEKIPRNKKESYIDCNQISGSTAQLLLVVKEVVRSFDETPNDIDFQIDGEVRIALRSVATYLKVNVITVLNKVTRDLKNQGQKIELDNFIEMVKEYIEDYYAASQFDHPKLAEEECQLIQAAYESVPTRYKIGNQEAIKLFFKNPHIPFLLKNGMTV